MATRAQTRSYNQHRKLCLALGIGQTTLNHKHLKGSFAPASPTGNRIYKGPGPLTTFAGEYKSTSLVWLVWQPFIRGEERPDDYGPGIIPSPEQEGQVPAIDDSANVIPLAADDFLVTTDGLIWTITNPVISPDGSFWTFMIEMQR